MEEGGRTTTKWKGGEIWGKNNRGRGRGEREREKTRAKMGKKDMRLGLKSIRICDDKVVATI